MSAIVGKNYEKPTLDLNFAENKSLIDSHTGRNLITFSRSQSGKEATYVGSDGLIKYAGADEPRFDHDPVTGECLGLLIEESRTNLIDFSEDFDTFFLKFNGGIGSIPSVTANAGLAPDGQLTADRIVFSLNGGTSTSDISEIRKNINVTTESHTFSFYIRSFDGASSYEMTIRDADGFIKAFTVTGEWERITFTSPNYIAGSIPVGFGLRGGSFADSDSADILVWGAQLEAGSFPTSYIPTSGAQVIRPADEATITGSNFSSWYNNNEGTIFGEYGWTTTTRNILSTAAGTGINGNNGFLRLAGTAVTIPSVKQAVGLTNFSVGNTASPANSISYLNGSAGGTGPNIFLTTYPPDLQIGRQLGSFFGYLNGYVSRITYWPKRLPDLELQQLTK